MHRMTLIVITINKLVRLHDQVVLGLGVVVERHVMYRGAFVVGFCHVALDTASASFAPFTNDLIRAGKKHVAGMLRLRTTALDQMLVVN